MKYIFIACLAVMLFGFIGARRSFDTARFAEHRDQTPFYQLCSDLFIVGTILSIVTALALLCGW